MAKVAIKEKDKYDHARANAAGWYETIVDLMQRLHTAQDQAVDGPDETEAVQREIEEGPLSIMVRDSWRTPGSASEGAEEYEILLSTGGPALRIYGTLNQYGEPETAELQMQDWYIPWEKWVPEKCDDKYTETLLGYARQFCFA